MFQPKVGKKPGVISPVTGQAVVVQTTCVDDTHVDDLKRIFKNGTPKGGVRYKLPKHDLPRRVESHLLALKKKNSRTKYRKGSGTDLKIITMLNGIRTDDVQNWEHVGVVQTPINPDDKTKPQGFRTNATRIGGTVSMINTGDDAIPPNACIYWDFPSPKEDGDPSDPKIIGQNIRGHPEGAIYPVIKVYDIVSEAAACAEEDEEECKRVLSKQQRIIGWSLNAAEPGCQLDVILKR